MKCQTLAASKWNGYLHYPPVKYIFSSDTSTCKLIRKKNANLTADYIFFDNFLIHV